MIGLHACSSPGLWGLQTCMNVCNVAVAVKLRHIATRAPRPRSRPMPASTPTLRHWPITLAVALLLAACGPSRPGGGFPGFPPAAVTTQVLQPRTLPVSYEFVGQTVGSKEVEVRARVTGILEKRLFQEGGAVAAGQTLYVIDPKPFEAQVAAAEAEVARAQRAGDPGRPRGGAPEAARRAARHRAEGSRRCGLQRRIGGGDGEGRRREARPRRGSISATRARSRRSPGCRAGRSSPRAASSTPTTRCSRSSGRWTRSGCRSTSPRTSGSRSIARWRPASSRCRRTTRST